MTVTLTQALEEADRQQITLFPECLEDWIWEDNPVRVIDFFVGGLDLHELHFGWVDPRRLAGLTHRSKKELPFTVLHIAGSARRGSATSSVAWTNRYLRGGRRRSWNHAR